MDNLHLKNNKYTKTISNIVRKQNLNLASTHLNMAKPNKYIEHLLYIVHAMLFKKQDIITHSLF